MTETTNPAEPDAVLLVAKSAFAAAPYADMERIAATMAEAHPESMIRFGFTEQGMPSLREALLDLVGQGVARISVVPLLLPMEPSFETWLKKSIRRWHHEDGRDWPEISIAGRMTDSPLMADLVTLLLQDCEQLELATDPKLLSEGSLVPAQKRRVLVCQGGACNVAGAEAIWCHLRNQQVRQKLRVTGDGTMTAKSTCLGPCNLAPVVQVFPEGTYYGGVTEAAIDRIISEHLLAGSVVDAFAYHPTGRKQRLRKSL
ncbi:(2Fe-2S) ferredoxin domain-containing protein [uncultured Hoeflea sp.]|uniref:(2Fe-2S) ferredoxin domain-containing protein n=1 Tax=uncultured Hoeflea sp. TaxID=538666 RepID=UPI0030D95C47